MNDDSGKTEIPNPRVVLIARPVWPVLRRLGELLSRRGYSVSMAATWGALFEATGTQDALVGVLLGEYGALLEEEEAVRRFRKECRPGVPVFLVGGQNAHRFADRFREAGVEMIFAADLPAEEILEGVEPLLAYGEMCRKAVLDGRKLSEIAMQDDLTGLPDRRRFEIELDRTVETARRIGRSVSCIVVDIDDFRRVNESHGERVRDSVIRQFGGVINKVRRRSDTVARLGGDQFAWILLGAGREEAMRAAQRAQRLLKDSVFSGAREPLRLTATFGVASLTPGGEWNAQSLVENADRALFWGKESGKNSIRCYPPATEATDA